MSRHFYSFEVKGTFPRTLTVAEWIEVCSELQAALARHGAENADADSHADWPVEDEAE
jgi:hypothetical protein